jgi:hypothetical protein
VKDIVLDLAYHWRVYPPFVSDDVTLQDAAFVQARLLGEAIRFVVDCKNNEQQLYDAVFVSSTLLPDFLTHEELLANGFKQDVTRFSGVKSIIYVSAYECAGWGYILRHIFHHVGPSRVLLIIADIDIQNSEFWKDNPSWGRSGFGITALSLELGTNPCIETRSIEKDVAFASYASFVRQLSTKMDIEKISAPFFRPQTWKLLEGKESTPRLFPNLYHEFGHSFGSDPWLGLIRAMETAPELLSNEVSIGVSSFALNGYYTAAKIYVAKDALLRIKCAEIKGSSIYHAN